MFASPRLAPVALAVFTTLLVFIFFQTTDFSATLKHVPQAVGFGEEEPSEAGIPNGGNVSSDLQDNPSQVSEYASPQSQFVPGIPKAQGSEYTKTVVIPRTKQESTYWIEEQLGDILYPKGPLQTAVYVVDDKNAELHPPKNKGHEVMVYLSYLIDHYDTLPDVVMFMHAHRFAWHNNDVLDYDAAQMIRFLSSERVTREGYMNLRCHWNPGCPDWLHPGATVRNYEKQEETLIAESWSELFPLDPIPSVLAQPCCSQFALSKERIQALPLSRYVYYRDWLLRTPLSDYLSGRVWEYLWQYVFTGQNVACPAPQACYCDGYGLCFGGDALFDEWNTMRYLLREYEAELSDWRFKKNLIEDAEKFGHLDQVSDIEVPQLGRDQWLIEEIQRLRESLTQRRDAAWARGQSPQLRAQDMGREWKEGDGF